MGIVIGCFLDFGHAAFSVRAVPRIFFVDNIANHAQVYFLPVWKKLEGEEQVRLRMSALTKMIKFLVISSWGSGENYLAGRGALEIMWS